MFKYVVVLFALIAAATAINPNLARTLLSGHNAYPTQQRTHSAASSDDVHAEIKSFNSDVRADGFNYAYDTTNGIAASESGDAYGVAHGDFGWTSPEGVHVAVQYVADENGYQPSSDLLPTPPPIPDYILRALEYIRTHPPKEAPSNNYGKHF